MNSQKEKKAHCKLTQLPPKQSINGRIIFFPKLTPHHHNDNEEKKGPCPKDQTRLISQWHLPSGLCFDIRRPSWYFLEQFRHNQPLEIYYTLFCLSSHPWVIFILFIHNFIHDFLYIDIWFSAIGIFLNMPRQQRDTVMMNTTYIFFRKCVCL